MKKGFLSQSGSQRKPTRGSERQPARRTDITIDDASYERAVDALLDDNVSASTAASAAARPATPVSDASPSDEMVMMASAMIEAQGPRPTFSDFASVPAQNPFLPPAAPDGASHVFVTRHGARSK